MENEFTKIPVTGKAVWMEAMKYGAILGIITVALDLLPKLWQPSPEVVVSGNGLNVSSALTTTLIGVLYFLVKTGICIWLMVFFTKKLTAVYDGLTSSHTFKFGMYMAMFSAIVVSAAVLIQVKMMDMGAITDMVHASIQAQGQGLQAEMAESVTDSIIGLMPVFTLLITFVKCFVIGILAALIISRSIPGRTLNPFERR